MKSAASYACPWCEHRAANGDRFRVHLMVEHRKSTLAAYVQDAVVEAALGETDTGTRSRASAPDGGTVETRGPLATSPGEAAKKSEGIDPVDTSRPQDDAGASEEDRDEEVPELSAE